MKKESKQNETQIGVKTVYRCAGCNKREKKDIKKRRKKRKNRKTTENFYIS